MTDGRAAAVEGSNFTRGAPDNAGDAPGGGGGTSASRRASTFSPLAPPDLATGADDSLSFGAPSCAAG
ncbi:hypothetical protein LZC95_42740 [Pendulispora brunnea]|uniref:Uncharacterized protein n=1 Tax=Pendulispora brunnea TaxID=2905690 RepID=A0ABZ2K711_9BACT